MDYNDDVKATLDYEIKNENNIGANITIIISKSRKQIVWIPIFYYFLKIDYKLMSFYEDLRLGSGKYKFKTDKEPL